ncbi:hypothetical protein EBR37_00410, partial [bacterium]|nr:hypothetical protein [bacterium]
IKSSLKLSSESLEKLLELIQNSSLENVFPETSFAVIKEQLDGRFSGEPTKELISLHSTKEESDESASRLNDSEGEYDWGTEEVGPAHSISFTSEEVSIRGIDIVISANYLSE